MNKRGGKRRRGPRSRKASPAPPEQVVPEPAKQPKIPREELLRRFKNRQQQLTQRRTGRELQEAKKSAKKMGLDDSDMRDMANNLLRQNPAMLDQLRQAKDPAAMMRLMTAAQPAPDVPVPAKPDIGLPELVSEMDSEDDLPDLDSLNVH